MLLIAVFNEYFLCIGIVSISITPLMREINFLNHGGLMLAHLVVSIHYSAHEPGFMCLVPACGEKLHKQLNSNVGLFLSLLHMFSVKEIRPLHNCEPLK